MTSDVITSETSGGAGGGTANSSQSSSEVNNTTIVLGGNIITATLLSTDSLCQCGAGGAACTGGTTITDLVVNGLSVMATGAPNQTINLLGGVTIILNEQTSTAPENITVNALRVTLAAPIITELPLADVVIASSQSGIACPTVTAANVSVSGIILDATGRAVSRAIITITGASGATKTTITNQFGNFRFDEIPAGEIYMASAVHKSYSFAPQVFSATDNLTGLDFVPLEKQRAVRGQRW